MHVHVIMLAYYFSNNALLSDQVSRLWIVPLPCCNTKCAKRWKKVRLLHSQMISLLSKPCTYSLFIYQNLLWGVDDPTQRWAVYRCTRRIVESLIFVVACCFHDNLASVKFTRLCTKRIFRRMQLLNIVLQTILI